MNLAEDFVKNLEFLHLGSDELAHYGVLGMKWGRRKAEGTSAVGKPKEPKKVRIDGSKKLYRPTASKDHVESRELLTKKKYELTNAEIDKITARINKEQKLSKIEPTPVNNSKKILSTTLGAIGTAGTIYGISQTPHGKAAIKAGSKIIKKLLK